MSVMLARAFARFYKRFRSSYIQHVHGRCCNEVTEQEVNRKRSAGFQANETIRLDCLTTFEILSYQENWTKQSERFFDM
jgi:hypothetical protein